LTQQHFNAGEHAVLAPLALRGYVANMTRGHIKGIDILAHHPETGRMLKKTTQSEGGKSKDFGNLVCSWSHGFFMTCALRLRFMRT
jgi:hypothetical protein